MEHTEERITEYKRRIEIMTAFLDGKKIEYKTVPNGWEETKSPKWMWRDYDYRIKVKKKLLPIRRCLDCTNRYFRTSCGDICRLSQRSIYDPYKIPDWCELDKA